MSRLLTLRAGPHALQVIRSRGLQLDDVDIVPGASGGAKWLVIGGLDRYLFGDFLQAPRTRPLHVIGSSIGSWRAACLGQHDPVAALARGHHGYIYKQLYTPKPPVAEVTRVLSAILDDILGDDGARQVVEHPTFRTHVLAARGRGLAASERRLALIAALGSAATANAVARRSLQLHFARYVFHSAGDVTPFAHLQDLPTTHRPLTAHNLRQVLLASGSIPLLMEGVRIPGEEGIYWDGGVLDYHLDLDYGPGDGIVLYPHFYGHIVPGWFDKSLPWRRASGHNLDRVLLVAPSPEFVRSLPGGKIPDRRDFFAFAVDERMRRWQATLDASAALGEELRALVNSGRVADVVQPW